MNYLAQINAFERWLETNYLPISSQLLWYKLMCLFNKCGWCEWVTVDNLRLMAAMQMGREATFIKVRDELIKAGLIEYKKGKKGSPNQYRITPFTDCTTNLKVKSEVYRAVESEVKSEVKSEVYSEVNTVANTVDINKLNKTNTKKDTKVSKEKVVDFFDCVWSMYPVKRGKSSVSFTQKQKLCEIGREEMERAISRYCEEKKDTDKQYWKNGSTFFNNGYVDYLDDNYTPVDKSSRPTKPSGNQFQNFPQRDNVFDYDDIIFQGLQAPGEDDNKDG